MTSKNSFNWRTLFFEVPLEEANSIIREQKVLFNQNRFNDNNNLFGPGIYLSPTVNGAHNLSNVHGCILSADVLMNQSKGIDEKTAEKVNNDYWKQLRNEGFDSIFAFGLKTGDEFIIFNQDHIKNIKFVKFGENNLNQKSVEENWNLNDILKTRENKITLFYATNLDKARSIESSQCIPFEKGTLGNGIYLFNTIEDALKHNTDANTFISVNADMSNYYQLHSTEELISQKVPKNCSSFYYENNSCKLFFFTNPNLINNIHICGDSNMQKHIDQNNATKIYHPPKQTVSEYVPKSYSKENKYVPPVLSPNKKFNSLSISKENRKSSNSEGNKGKLSQFKDNKYVPPFSPPPNKEYDSISLNGNHLNKHYNYWHLS